MWHAMLGSSFCYLHVWNYIDENDHVLTAVPGPYMSPDNWSISKAKYDMNILAKYRHTCYVLLHKQKQKKIPHTYSWCHLAFHFIRLTCRSMQTNPSKSNKIRPARTSIKIIQNKSLNLPLVEWNPNTNSKQLYRMEWKRREISLCRLSR